MDDLDIHLSGIQDRDDDAFGHWLRGAERPLRASLRSFAGRLDTEALLQETLLRVWLVAKRVECDGRGNSLLRMAKVIARNLACSELRRARVAPMEIEELERIALGDASIEPSFPDPLLRELLRECHRLLPRQPGLALGLRLEAAGSEPDASLAERAGMRLNTFLQNVVRARKLLRRCLAERGVTELAT